MTKTMKLIAMPAILGLLVGLAAAPAAAQSLATSKQMCEGKFGVHAQLTGCTRLLTQFHLSPQERAITYNNRGIAYISVMRYREAIADFGQAIQLNPRYAEPYNNRATVYRHLKQYQKAIADFDQAIRLNPSNAKAYNNRGVVYGDLKLYQRAIADYDQAIRLNPRYTKAYNNRGRAHGALKHFQLAIADFDRAIRFDPRFAPAYANRSWVRCRLKRPRLGIADANKALSLREHADAYAARACNHAVAGNRAQAIRDYETALRLDPAHSGAPGWRAVLSRLRTNTSSTGEGPTQHRLVGRHLFSLQWISWTHFGTAIVRPTARPGVFHISGFQRRKVPYTCKNKNSPLCSTSLQDFVRIDGLITNVTPRSFKFVGTIRRRIFHLEGSDGIKGSACVRRGVFTFAVSGKRKFWRLQQMDACGVADYVDIFFGS